MRSSVHRNQKPGSTVLALFETLFDIIRLRKGPEAIPHSGLLLLIALGLWLFSGIVVTLMTPEFDWSDLAAGTVASLSALAGYVVIIALFGRSARVLRATIAVLGCSALLSLMSTASSVFLTPFFSANLSSVVVTLILLWSVPVEGHIISRTIERHWYLGVVIAMAAFIFQWVLYKQINPTTT